MAYEALYRRYRPSQFGDVAGQSHVVSALRNAVEGDRVGHAYLFSGPRGTGKTSSARILAKALNCTNLQGGEPCDECESCLAFQSGGSYDLHELDAASNNGVDAMRDLIGKVALGSPGRTKVYILDEVHMLTSGAENALLKTLEEPPPHVVFVLCTTEPNKVVPTIRSRTQHLEFSLLTEAQVGGLVDHVIADAALEVSDDDRAYVIRVGGGSARDTLSALDQVVAAGGAPQGGEHLESLFQALVDRDGMAALAAIDGALQSGRDPAGVAASLLADLRSVFLATMRADLDQLSEAERTQAEARAASLSPARVTRAIEVIGESAIEMRQAPDPRVDLEVAVIRLTRPDLDITPEALLERIEALEQGAPSQTQRPAPSPTPPEAPSPASQPAPALEAVAPQPAPEVVAPQPAPEALEADPSGQPVRTAGQRGADMARAALAQQKAAPAEVSQAMAAAAPPDLSAAPKLSKTLADVRAERHATAAGEPEPEAAAEPQLQPQPEPEAAAQPEPVAEMAPPAEPSAAEPSEPSAAESSVPSAPEPVTPAAQGAPTLGELQAAWDGGLLESLSGRARSRFSAGRFLENDDGVVVFGLPNPVHRDRCEEIRGEVDDALASQFGRPVPLALVVDQAEHEPDFLDAPRPASAPEPAEVEADEAVDLDALVDAHDAAAPSAVDRVLTTFEGSVVLDEHPPSAADEAR